MPIDNLFANMRERISLTIPVYNDAPSLASLHRDLIESGMRQHVSEVILVDDGSIDETWAECLRLSEIDSLFRVIQHKKNLGLGAAIRTGVLNSSEKTVAWLPADLQIDLPEFEAIVRRYQTGKIVLFARRGRIGFHRNALSRVAHALLRLLFAVDLRDHCGVFILPKVKYQESLPITSRAISCLELAVRLNQQNTGVSIVEVTCHERQYGKSKTYSLRSVVRSVRELVGLALIDSNLLRGSQRSKAGSQA